MAAEGWREARTWAGSWDLTPLPAAACHDDPSVCQPLPAFPASAGHRGQARTHSGRLLRSPPAAAPLPAPAADCGHRQPVQRRRRRRRRCGDAPQPVSCAGTAVPPAPLPSQQAQRQQRQQRAGGAAAVAGAVCAAAAALRRRVGGRGAPARCRRAAAAPAGGPAARGSGGARSSGAGCGGGCRGACTWQGAGTPLIQHPARPAAAACSPAGIRGWGSGRTCCCCCSAGSCVRTSCRLRSGCVLPGRRRPPACSRNPAVCPHGGGGRSVGAQRAAARRGCGGSGGSSSMAGGSGRTLLARCGEVRGSGREGCKSRCCKGRGGMAAWEICACLGALQTFAPSTTCLVPPPLPAALWPQRHHATIAAPCSALL